jgi:hypothetical protein
VSRPQLPSAKELLLFIAVAFGWIAIDELFGQAAAFRYWGAGLLAAGVVFACRKTVPFFLGSTKVRDLSGVPKNLVAGVAISLGVAILLYPDTIACAVSLRGYVCGAQA